jgi:phosphatidylserine/phosphatidylglycerophosphate/cardiolipin synthase-like enzyme
MRTQPRLPWHDVGVKVSGKVVSDLVHHFYQLWHFVRYENKQ